MLQEKELEKLIENEGLNCFEVIPPNEWEKKSLHLNKNTIEELVRFAKSNSLKNIFYSYYYYSKDEFIITKEEAIKEIGLERYLLIKNDVEKYNDSLEDIDYSVASNFLAFCIFEENLFTITEVDNWLEKLNITDKIEKLYEFLYEYEDNFDEVEEEINIRVNRTKLRNNLKDKILNDPESKTCNSRRLVRKYIENLLEQKGMEEYRYDLYIKGGFTGEYTLDEDFIELVWRELKEKKSKRLQIKG